MKQFKELREGRKLEPLMLNVVNHAGEAIGKVRSTAWKQASMLLGVSAKMEKHKVHGWSWVPAKSK